jgi:NitT/TauT family transport system substrate-binding protein
VHGHIRRLLCLTALPALALAGCSGSSSAAPQASSAPVRLVVSYSEIYEGSWPLWLTADAGLFKKHGLDVELQYIASATSIAALTAGQTQVSQGGGSEALSATVGGADLVLIGNLVPVYPYVFEVPASIKSLNDLRGKKVGVSAAGSQSDIATRAGLARVGLSPDKDVTIVPVGSSQNRTAALQTGSIQGGLDQPPYSIILERSGFHPLFDLAALKLPTVNNGIVVQRSFLKDHKSAAQSYVDALIEGIARLKKDRAYAVAVLKKWLKMDDDPAANATYDFAVDSLFPSLPHIKPEHMADAVEVLSQKNPKVKDFDIKKMIDDSFVKSAADRHVGG